MQPKLKSPFRPAPVVYLSQPWRTNARGNLTAKVKTPTAEYSLRAFQIAGTNGWNAAVFSDDGGYRQYAVGYGESLSREAALSTLHDFIVDLQEHFNEQTYAAAA